MPPRCGGAWRRASQRAARGHLRSRARLLRSRGVDALLTYRGRAITPADVAFLRALLAAQPHAQPARPVLRRLRRLAVGAAQRAAVGHDLSRLALALHRAGHLVLPPAPLAHRQAVAPAHQRAAGARWTRARSWPRCAPCARWRSARSGGRPTRRSSTACSRSTTTSGYQQPVGEHLKYLVVGRRPPARLFRVELGPAAPGPARSLHRLVGRRPGAGMCASSPTTARFLILPWVAVPHLASHLLGAHGGARAGRVGSASTATRSTSLETFIDPARFRGTCYRAANWRVLGPHHGRGTTRRPHASADPAGQGGPRLSPRAGLSRPLDEDDLSRRRRKPAGPRAAPPPLELRFDELGAIVERTKAGALSADDHAKLKAAMDTLAFLTAELQAKQTSLDRLRRLLFGAADGEDPHDPRPGAAPGRAGPRRRPEARGRPAAAGPPRPGHGRLGAAAYTGADTGDDRAPHAAPRRRLPRLPDGQDLSAGGARDAGADHRDGPAGRHRLRVRALALQPVRRGLHRPGARRASARRSTTRRPRAWSACSSTAWACRSIASRSCSGRCGIPLPAATQWELVRDALPRLAPVWDELLRQAAQGEVVYNDDTTMKILALTAEQRRAAAADEETDARTGVFTSGIVATRDGHRIALFFTGRQHAGENLADVLAQRAAALAPPDPDVRRARRQHRGRLRHASSPTAWPMRAAASSTWSTTSPPRSASSSRPCARSTAPTPSPASGRSRPTERLRLHQADERPADGRASRRGCASNSTSTWSSPTPAWAPRSPTCSSTGRS